MAQRQHGLAVSRRQQQQHGLTVADLRRYIEGWILDSQVRQHSGETIALHKRVTEKLLWFLDRQQATHCGTLELRQFLAYLTDGHNEEGGRWGNSKTTSCQRPVKARTVQDYYIELRTLFNWIVADGALEVSPLAAIKPIVVRDDQVQPFTQDQVAALMKQARRSDHPRRDEAILLLLLDTGIRESELCALRMKDADLRGRHITVQGKGNKTRQLPYADVVAKALWSYLKEQPREPNDPLFLTEKREAFTRNGLYQLVRRLGQRAGIDSVRCSPHTFRHTFAIEFLRGGAQEFTLQTLLGHTSLTMTKRYVDLAQADIANQHRQFSPADRYMRGGK